MPSGKYYFITDSEGAFYSGLTLNDTLTAHYVRKAENAVSFSSQSRAENYARKFLSPFTNTFELKIIAIYGDYSQNECLFTDI